MALVKFMNPLPYSPAASARLRWRRTCLVGLFLVSIAVSAFVLRARIGRTFAQSLMLKYQRDCLEVTGKPTQVVYEEDHKQPLELGRGWRLFVTPDGDLESNPGVRWAEPTCWANYSPTVSGRDLRNPGPLSDPPATLLVHGYKTSGGTQQLAVLQLRKFGESSGAWNLEFHYEIIQLGTFKQNPRLFRVRSYLFLTTTTRGSAPDFKRLRMYAAQLDRYDPLHFKIRYQLKNEDGFFDGRIGDNDITLLQLAGSPTPNWLGPSGPLENETADGHLISTAGPYRTVRD